MTSGKSIPTGDQSWTLFLSMQNFKRLIGFFTPFFWSHEALAHPGDAGRMMDTQPSDPALIVKPPKGDEIGYCPISTRQELVAKWSLPQNFTFPKIGLPAALNGRGWPTVYDS